MHHDTQSRSTALLGRRQVLGLALAAGAGLAGAPALAQSGRTLRVGYIGPGKHPAAAIGWAIAQGHLQRELAPLGFTGVSLHTFPNGPDLNEAFLSGALDVGIYGDTPAVVGRARGLDGRLLGFEEVGIDAWLLTPRGGVTSIQQLEGKTIGVALGSYMHRYVLGLIKEAGLSRNTRVVYTLPRDGEPALEKGALAAFAAPINTGPSLAAKGYPVLDQASRHTGLVGSSIAVASGKLLQAAPAFAAAWQRARRTALGEIRKDTERYYAFHSEAAGFPVPIVKASHPLSHFPDEAYPAEGLKLLDGVRSFLLAENLIREDVNLAGWRL